MRVWGGALLAFLVMTFVFTGNAHAYIDPGAVSFLFQAVLAAFLGAVIVVKRYWHGIKGWIRNLRSPREE